MKEHYTRMFEHAHWASGRLLEHLQRVACSDDRTIRLLAHIYGAEQVWLARLRGEDSSGLPIWPEGGLDYCERAAAANKAGYGAFFSGLPADGLLRMAQYSNSSGKTFSTSVADILTHVSLHGSYHRGQINTRLSNSGCETVGLDYILYVRETS